LGEIKLKRTILAIAIFIFVTNGISQDEYKEWVQRQNIPRWIYKTFSKKKLNNIYEFSFLLNPFYLRGDFNGDNHADIALLIKEKKTKKLGIAIFHSVINKVTIVGAGNKIGNGGDDLKWLGIWRVHESKKVKQGAETFTPPNLQGEAIYVEKPESASSLIYWDGKKYKWYQQGD
jgi:hypothetical protein